MSRRNRSIKAGVIIGAFLVFLAVSVIRTIDSGVGTYAYFETVSECALGLADGRIRLGDGVRIHGNVEVGSIQRDLDDLSVEFRITDGDAVFAVVYESLDLSDLFKDGADVVVEGRLDDDEIVKATSIMAKCPTKYQAAEESSEA